MKKLLIGLVIVALLLAGVAWWISAPRSVAISKDILTFASVQKGELKETVSATGRLQPTHIVVVGSEIPGTVVQVLGEVNQVVVPGQVLVKLDDRLARLKVEQAEDGVKTAQAALNKANAMLHAAEIALKYQRDLEKSGGFRSERDKAEAELKAAKAGVKIATARLQAARTQKKEAQFGLDQTLIKVPDRQSPQTLGWNSDVRHLLAPLVLGGERKYLILEKNVKVGQMVSPQSPQPLFTLAGNLQKMEVETEIVEGDIGKVQAGLKAVFSITSYDDPDRRFTGTVREIRPLPSNVRGAIYYNAVIDAINEKNPETKEWRLRPGMTASVDIILRQKENAWKVPAAALNFQMDKLYESDEAKERIRSWKEKENWNDWRPVWIWQADKNRVWPVFVRLFNTKTGKRGIQDGEFHEVLEWEAGFEPITNLQLIIAAPPAREPGLLDRPANFKLS